MQQIQKHNTANDCWIVLFKPLIQAAGTDITFWFDQKRQPRTKVNPETAETIFHCPKGIYLHLYQTQQIKWWKNTQFIIGKLTKKARKIDLHNMLTDQICRLLVPQQQTINQILIRYLFHNKHGASYTWKRLGRPLDMTKTLKQNGIQDQDPQFQRLGLPKVQWYVPTIHLFFNDDLTQA